MSGFHAIIGIPPRVLSMKETEEPGSLIYILKLFANESSNRRIRSEWEVVL